MRAKTIFPGGFVICTPLIGRLGADVDPACRVCKRASCAPGWLHRATHQIVCKRCMGDIWENGPTISERIADEDCPCQ